MKKGTLGKIIGTLGLAAVLSICGPKRANSLENLIDGIGRINGNIIETISETPVIQGVELKLKEYLGNGVIGDELGSCQTDSDGNFSLDIDTSSNYAKVEISKPDSSYYWAERYVSLEDSILLDIVERYDADVYNMETESTEKMDFMEFFNSWFRAMNGCTQRWANEDEGGKGLKVFIKTNLAVPSQIDSVYSIIQNKWPRFTQRVGKEPLIQNTHIEQGEVIPNYIKSDWDGWAAVGWTDSGDPFHVEELDGNRIYSATAILTPVADNRAITEELLQILGARAETPDRFFWDINGNVLESGWRCGKIVCSRPIGSMNPDINPEPQVEIRRYIKPPVNLVVADVPNDNGHQLKLIWEKSPSEEKNLVGLYRIFYSENENKENVAVIDSVNAGIEQYIDRNNPNINDLCYYWLQGVSDNRKWESELTKVKWDGLSDAVEENNPKEFYLSNAYPNPFNSNTTIDYTIPKGSDVELVIYNTNGERIKTLDCGWRNVGSYRANWDGTDKKGNKVGNGVYFYQLNAGKCNKTGKLMLVK